MAGTARGKGWHPTPTRSAWLDVGSLTVDSTYERPMNPRKITKIAAEFDPDAVGSIYVSEREDGRFVILDGQHRVQAVLRLWGPKERVPCLIYTGLSHEDEARLFVLFNEHRTKPRPMDIFRAKIEARDPVALSITKLVEEAGFQLHPNKVSCVQALAEVHEHGGADVLARALSILGHAWGYDATAAQATLVRSIGLVVSRHKSTLDDQRLVKALRDTTPGQLLAKARMAKESAVEPAARGRTAWRLDTTVARITINIYNRGLRTQAKMLTWHERPARHFWSEAADADQDEDGTE